MSISNRPPRLELVTAVRNRCASAPVCRVYIYGSGKVRRERLPDCESQRPRATSGCRDRHSTIVVDCQIPTDKREIPFSQIPSRFTPHAFVFSIIDHRQPDPRYLCYLAPRPPYRRRAPRVLPICTMLVFCTHPALHAAARERG